MMITFRQLESRLCEAAKKLRDLVDPASPSEGLEAGHPEATEVKKCVSALDNRGLNVCSRQYGAVIQEENQW